VYEDLVAAAGAPLSIHLPWYVWGSRTEKNHPDPTLLDFFFATENGLYRVNDGSTVEDVTPGSAVGIGPNLLTSVYGTNAAAVLDDAGTRKLYTSTDGAASFSYVQDMNDDCKFIRSLRGDVPGNRLFVANGSEILYSQSWGATFSTKNVPVGTDVILSFDPYG